tara:strand:+ start:1373 stop:1657 length:285 start_codon:yes stop_codon:yes gene_type:complete
MSTRERTTRLLAVGDRVTETKNFGDHCIRKDHPDFEKVAKIVRNRRVGNIVEMISSKDARGHKIWYAMVLWDEYKTPSQHHVMRLKKIEAKHVG